MRTCRQVNPHMKSVLVIGLGMTGYSIIRHLRPQNVHLTVADTRDLPPYLSQVRKEFPEIEIIKGGIPVHRVSEFDEIVISPGIEFPACADRAKVKLIGDIELFARQANAPVIGITGSNGKSTVTMLVSEMLRAAGKTILLGGNIGIPALDLLRREVPDFYVLELSSFQLETTSSLEMVTAAVLNISEDHMDRYHSIDDYMRAKMRVFRHAEATVINREDIRLCTVAADLQNATGFGLHAPANDSDFGLVDFGTHCSLLFGQQELIGKDEITLQGDQNIANILAAMALVKTAGVDLTPAVIQAAAKFRGLPHRCEVVTEHQGVKWINDSKGTNVGAAVAAIKGIRQPIILIAGGQGKGTDFTRLARCIDKYVSHTILFGEDAELISRTLSGSSRWVRADSLEDAISIAMSLSKSGEVVLFSPACASFDMFDNYEHRGTAFKQLVYAKVLS